MCRDAQNLDELTPIRRWRNCKISSQKLKSVAQEVSERMTDEETSDEMVDEIETVLGAVMNKSRGPPGND